MEKGGPMWKLKKESTDKKMQVDVKVYANHDSVRVHLNYMCSITSTIPDLMLNIKFQRSMMFVLNF